MLTYVVTGFIYLVFGTLLLPLNLLGMLIFDRDAIFLIWFFGFVVMMVFGIPYVFIPGFSRSKFVNPNLGYTEYILLNIGIIFLFISIAGFLQYIFTLYVATLFLIISVLIHSINMWNMVFFRKKSKIK